MNLYKEQTTWMVYELHIDMSYFVFALVVLAL